MMLRFGLLIALILSTPASANEILTNARVSGLGDGHEIRLEGTAAAALFDSLDARSDTLRMDCSNLRYILGSPALCTRTATQTVCIIQISSEAGSKLQIPDHCSAPNPVGGDGPNPSIIGVGNGRNLPGDIRLPNRPGIDIGRGLNRNGCE